MNFLDKASNQIANHCSSKVIKEILQGKTNIIKNLKVLTLSFIFLLDINNKITAALIVKEEEKIKNLKYICQFDYYDIICLTPFGLYLNKRSKYN